MQVNLSCVTKMEQAWGPEDQQRWNKHEDLGIGRGGRASCTWGHGDRFDGPSVLMDLSIHFPATRANYFKPTWIFETWTLICFFQHMNMNRCLHYNVKCTSCSPANVNICTFCLKVKASFLNYFAHTYPFEWPSSLCLHFFFPSFILLPSFIFLKNQVFYEITLCLCKCIMSSLGNTTSGKPLQYSIRQACVPQHQELTSFYPCTDKKEFKQCISDLGYFEVFFHYCERLVTSSGGMTMNFERWHPSNSWDW